MRYLKNIWVLVWLLSYSCQEKIDWPLSPQEQNVLVVEGLFTNEKRNHLVRLTHAYLDINGDPPPVSGAVVAIFNEDSLHYLTEVPIGSGLYFTDSIQAAINRPYALFINYDGQEHTGGDIQLPVEPLQGPAYVQAQEGLFALNLSSQGSNPNYVKNLISWTQTPQCESANDVCVAKVINYDIKTIDINSIFKPDKVNITFPSGTLIVRQKFSVSGGYQAFLRAMLSETEWRGGVFDIERANTLTNMSNGAVGYFALSTVVSDTTIVP
jgi:hypothetical protein